MAELMYESRDATPWYQTEDAAWELAQAQYGEMSDAEIAYRAEMADQDGSAIATAPRYARATGHAWHIIEGAVAACGILSRHWHDHRSFDDTPEPGTICRRCLVAYGRREAGND